MGVYGSLWMFMGIYECLWVSGCHGCLCVLYLNIKILPIFSFKKPKRFQNLIKRLQSHMCYKK